MLLNTIFSNELYNCKNWLIVNRLPVWWNVSLRSIHLYIYLLAAAYLKWLNYPISVIVVYSSSLLSTQAVCESFNPKSSVESCKNFWCRLVRLLWALAYAWRLLREHWPHDRFTKLEEAQEAKLERQTWVLLCAKSLSFAFALTQICIKQSSSHFILLVFNLVRRQSWNCSRNAQLTSSTSCLV